MNTRAQGNQSHCFPFLPLTLDTSSLKNLADFCHLLDGFC